MAEQPGRFITLEGLEGSGKSTQIPLIRQHLERAGKKVLTTREPGGTPLGERIRALLLDKSAGEMSADTETLLVFAARAEHIVRVIRPGLSRGEWVICDRFTDATFAYQGGGRSIPDERIGRLETWVQNGLQPDLVLVLDVPVEVGLGRARSRGEADRFETEQADFFSRIRAKYLDRARVRPERYRVIEAARPVERVTRDILTALEPLL